MKKKVIKFLFFGITIFLISIVFLNSNVNSKSNIKLTDLSKISKASAEDWVFGNCHYTKNDCSVSHECGTIVYPDSRDN